MSDPYAGRAFAPSGAKTPRAGPYAEGAGAASPPYYVKEDAAEEAAPFPQNEERLNGKTA